jgi:hypothetical protein
MKFPILFLVIFLVGCASTAKNMEYISVGMSKPAVISVLGEPSETRASEDVEYMIYRLRTASSAELQAGCGAAGIATLGLVYLFKACRYSDDDYFILLKQGKVTAYGRMGEFDSTRMPEAPNNLNETSKETR